MKSFKIKLLLGCFTTGLLTFSYAIDMKPTFRDENYKKIAFSASIGGAPHINWVLSICNELGLRGHNLSFLTTSEEIKFGQSYENVKTYEIGPSVLPDDRAQFLRDMSGGEDALAFFPKVIDMATKNYEKEYLALLNYFKTNEIDLALCDILMNVCVDAATTLNIPYIITAAMDFTTESSASYVNNDFNYSGDFSTESQTFLERLKQKFIAPYIGLYHFWPHLQSISARRRALGIDVKLEAPSDTWKDSLKLVNCLFGFIPARPIGPMAEYVGPIIPRHYKPLSGQLAEYMNGHKRMAYVAFGQAAVPSTENIRLVLTSLLESIEVGTFDGFLWSTVYSAGFFPESITTASNTSYNVKDMFDFLNPHARLMQWTPQIAVLLHPSTAIFISHGGLGSWYESMYAAKPMIVFPFFGDQLGNAFSIERDGLGGYMRADATVEEATRLLKKVAADIRIKANVKRTQALVQIHSEHGIIRGADIIEEVAYTHQDGKLPHRFTADRRMSYWKASNMDLYVVVFLLLAAGLSLSIYAGYKISSALIGIFKIIIKKQKLKSL
ncbi:uncharacterized protein EV154DRAFT_553305 [Mucor mucedo]|uniref:uncharacterized protein n=1 Tax=Mucor mucedo TaxID=29922 RepID=UPI00221EF387|nr:uncharacterized protein EV154DRAFT_553305 [Mucor mucedo]KAI7889149.1 hypothetical protein EV154DRAFT_553305 [Mucor mucedo]